MRYNHQTYIIQNPQSIYIYIYTYILYYKYNAIAALVYYNLQFLYIKYRGVFKSDISSLSCLQLTTGQCLTGDGKEVSRNYLPEKLHGQTKL